MFNRVGAARNPLLIVTGLVVGVLAIYFGFRQMWSGLQEIGIGSNLVSQVKTASDAGLAEMKVFDGAPAISLKYPATWEVPAVEPPVVFQAETLKGAINFSLANQSFSAKEEMSLDEYTAANMEEIKKLDLPTVRFDKVVSDQKIEVNGIPVHKFILGVVATPSGKSYSIRQLTAFFIVDREAFILTCSAPNEGFDTTVKLFEAVLNSIQRK